MKIIVKKEKNYGIAVLRIFLAFMVVLDHFYEKKKLKRIIHILYYHIPTFFLLSFFYTNNSFAKFNITKIKLRFERLAIPYFCWSLISWVLYNIYFYAFKKKCYHSTKDFLSNLLNGHAFIPALWFQNIILLTTLLISIIVFSFKKYYILILQILLILAYIFQYSGLNYTFFKEHFNYLYFNTYGRLADTFPNSITGFFIAGFSIQKKLNSHKLKVVIISLIVLILVSISKLDSKLKSFKYGGLRLNTAAICIFFIFFYSILDLIINNKIKKYIDIVTNYTAGIYFSHYLIGRSYFMYFLLDKKIKTIFGSIFIYLISYAFCFFMDKIFGNTKLKHLFK